MFGLIVYGSLLHKEEISKYDSLIENIIPIKVSSYKRSFNLLPARRVGIGNYKSVLNIQKSSNNSFNGVCIIYKEVDIASIDDREKGYDRILINSKDIITNKKADILSSINIYAYKGLDHMIDHSIMPNVDYLKLCLEGSKQYGDKFYKNFITSTHMNNDFTLEDFIKSNFSL